MRVYTYKNLFLWDKEELCLSRVLYHGVNVWVGGLSYLCVCVQSQSCVHSVFLAPNTAALLGREGGLEEVEMKMQKVFVFLAGHNGWGGFMGGEDRRWASGEMRDDRKKWKRLYRGCWRAALKKRDDGKLGVFYLGMWSCPLRWAKFDRKAAPCSCLCIWRPSKYVIILSDWSSRHMYHPI